eukprot:scaffold2469_cov239-Pinguiococcus_pyrenoidosus.AAC.13
MDDVAALAAELHEVEAQQPRPRLRRGRLQPSTSSKTLAQTRNFSSRRSRVDSAVSESLRSRPTFSRSLTCPTIGPSNTRGAWLDVGGPSSLGVA